MPWVKRRRKKVLASADARKARSGPTRTVLPDGTVEETSAAMGKIITVPGNPLPPPPFAMVATEDAGWERWREVRRRLLGVGYW
jgi:hypothetical protein